MTVTSTTDNTMAYWSLGSHYGRAYSAGANTTLISASSDSQEWTFRSTNLKTPAGALTLNATISAGTEPAALTGFAIKPAPPAPTNTTNNGCHGELHGTFYCQQ